MTIIFIMAFYKRSVLYEYSTVKNLSVIKKYIKTTYLGLHLCLLFYVFRVYTNNKNIVNYRRKLLLYSQHKKISLQFLK